MTDTSIEYAHIYTNKQISKEHQISIDILGKVKGELSKTGMSSNLVVMVDDYSFPDPTFDYESFVSWLDEKGFKPDFVYRESQLIPVCDMVLALMSDSEMKNKIILYIQAKKYPCSLFIAAWYLLRLGKLEHPTFSTEIEAEQLINILPDSFKPFEDAAIEIIKATKYESVVGRITNEYIDGRLIA